MTYSTNLIGDHQSGLRSHSLCRIDWLTVILQRSGTGPSEWLSPLGIEMVHESRGVGQILQDHLQQRAIYKVDGIRTLNETYYSLGRRAMMGLDYAFRR